MTINKYIGRAFLLGVLGMGAFSCSDLKDVAIDKVTDASSISPAQQLASAYGQMYWYVSQDKTFALQEHSTDEFQGPTRGTDWDDNGRWRNIHTHTWTGTSVDVVGAWDDLNKGHALANEAINNAGTNASVKAQGLFVRAFFMYEIMDLFGKVPFKETSNGTVTASVLSRTQAADKIIADLETALPNLVDATATPSATIQGTKQAAQALLAKIYLNRGVYSASAIAGPYTFAAADMDKVITYTDAIINSGKFALNTNYFDNFTPDNDTKSKELVYNLPYTRGVNPVSDNYGSNQRLVYPGTHYNQNPSGWNGFTTLSDFYNGFEAGDARLGGTVVDKTKSGITNGFLIGQQYDQAGKALTDRQGSPLIFSKDCSLTNAVEKEGIRVIKMGPDFVDPVNGGNDFPFIRYADVLLMKAEALLRKGNAAGGLVLVNQVRIARGLKAATALTEASLLAERAHEFYVEGWRRNDLIRFGKFNDPVINRPTASAAFRRVYPIPQKEIEINPALTQNEGY